MKKKDNKKEINGSLIKEALVDYNNLGKTLKENVAESVKDLLKEEVVNAYRSLLSESDDDEGNGEDYEVEEVEDTAEEPEESEDNVADTADGEDDTEDLDADVEENGIDEPEVESSEDEGEEVTDGTEEGEDGGLGDEFDSYKVSDGEYDLRDADDDEIVAVYKKLKPEDGVTVVKDGGKVKISDNENEYIIDLDGDGEEDSQEEMELNDEQNMTESRIYEIMLDEYDSHVGYTDNYQNKDVMTTDGTSEPSKYGRDIDKGVPTGTSKPWANPDKKAKPFDKGTKNEGVDECGEEPMTEAHNVGGFVEQNTTTASELPNSNGRNGRNAHKAGKQVNSTASNRTECPEGTNESIQKKYQKILKENKQLASMVNKFKSLMQEAALSNVNLGGIVKLMVENSTSREEKQNIIDRFNKTRSIDESKELYNVITEELKKKPQGTVDLNEDKQYSSKSTDIIKESKVYQDENLINSLNLMHKITK